MIFGILGGSSLTETARDITVNSWHGCFLWSRRPILVSRPLRCRWHDGFPNAWEALGESGRISNRETNSLQFLGESGRAHQNFHRPPFFPYMEAVLGTQ